MLTIHRSQTNFKFAKYVIACLLTALVRRLHFFKNQPTPGKEEV